MLRTSLLAAIALLGSSSAAAQDPLPPWELGAPAAPSGYAAPVVVEEERPPVHAPLGDLAREPEGGGSVGMEVVGGLIGYAVPVGLALAIGFADDSSFGAALLMLGATPFTVTAGIYLAGNATGGSGSFGYTLLGQAIGGLISAPIAVGLFFATLETDEHCGDFDNPCADRMDGGTALALGILASAGLSIGGGVLAYELSAGDAHEVTIGVTPTASGATLAVSGRL